MNYIVTRNPDFFRKIGNYNLKDIKDIKPFEGRIALDTETTGLKARHNDIFCVQVGTGKDNYIFDLQNHPLTSNQNLKIYLKEVWPLINNCEWVLQNAVFDLGFFYQNNLFPLVVFDTFIASKILHNGEHASTRHDFGTLMKRHLNIVYDKTDQKNIHKVKLSQPSTIEYSFNDVDKLLELHSVIYSKLERYGAIDSYLLHCRYIRGLAYMEQCGLPISSERWLEKMENDKLIADKKQQEVIHYIFDNLSQYRKGQLSLFDTDKKITVLLSSPKQMIPVFKALGINVLDKDGKESIEEGVIASSKHEFVKLWLEYNKAVHNVTTFGKSVLDKIENGRIYTVFNPILDTARISTRSGEINFLNFPRGEDTRKCFVANEGYQMICSDYEGQENAISADLSGDKTMVDVILKGLDLHCAFARLIFPEIKDLSDSEIKKQHAAKRDFSKSPRFALAYGGSGYTISINQNLPIEEGNRLEALYKELHAGIYEWGNKVFQAAIKVGYIESANGFKLKLPNFDEFQKMAFTIADFSKEFWERYRSGKEEYQEQVRIFEHNLKNEDKLPPYKIINQNDYDLYMEYKGYVSKYFKLRSQYMRLCLNNPIQTTAAHQTKLAVTLLFEYIIKKGHQWKARISNVPHDEILLEVTKDLVPEYCDILGRIMRYAGDQYMTSGIIKMKADAAAGDSWYSAKKG